MGVFPSSYTPSAVVGGLPHTRGGVSSQAYSPTLRQGSSPHPWGCFWSYNLGLRGYAVFPTPVGVFLIRAKKTRRTVSLPHTRGGVSGRQDALECCCLSSPHPWGCFSLTASHSHQTGSLPHTRGGVSTQNIWYPPSVPSSPHPWGCFPSDLSPVALMAVFPTPVGVFPRCLTLPKRARCLPHTRGGVSGYQSSCRRLVPSSPHPWGCFRTRTTGAQPPAVFPTPVGVFPNKYTSLISLLSLPHTRGGVSNCQRCHGSLSTSSPHPWGCFRTRTTGAQPPAVFPTPVGVFRLSERMMYSEEGLPHTRGGVSISRSLSAASLTSSPHPWGCFFFRILRNWR